MRAFFLLLTYREEFLRFYFGSLRVLEVYGFQKGSEGSIGDPRIPNP